ncbi:hypothetical protein [Novosphingobium rosa]|uniref:hypothetical protein n=1 Tax=Novosphingobium rosa TaxID=76978 RepID=UPI00082F4B19|nr:hypothetical protein [Novosphingobium rosa]
MAFMHDRPKDRTIDLEAGLYLEAVRRDPRLARHHTLYLWESEEQPVFGCLLTEKEHVDDGGHIAFIEGHIFNIRLPVDAAMRDHVVRKYGKSWAIEKTKELFLQRETLRRPSIVIRIPIQFTIDLQDGEPGSAW